MLKKQRNPWKKLVAWWKSNNSFFQRKSKPLRNGGVFGFPLFFFKKKFSTKKLFTSKCSRMQVWIIKQKNLTKKKCSHILLEKNPNIPVNKNNQSYLVKNFRRETVIFVAFNRLLSSVRRRHWCDFAKERYWAS